MYFFMFHGTPEPQNPNAAKIGGAFINCWVERSTLSEAESAARQWIKSAQWNVVSLDETRIVEQSDYDDDPTGAKFFEQALTDKEVFVFHCYPMDDKDD